LKIQWFQDIGKWRVEIDSFATMFSDIEMVGEINCLTLRDGGATKFNTGISKFGHGIGVIMMEKISLDDWNILLEGLIE